MATVIENFKHGVDRLVFLYLVNRRLPVDFRQFLIRYLALGVPVRAVNVRAWSSAAARISLMRVAGVLLARATNSGAEPHANGPARQAGRSRFRGN